MDKRVIYTGMGKTTSLIDQCAQNNGYMVVHTMAEVSRVAALAKSEGYVMRRPLTYDQFLKRPTGSPRGFKVYIDNVEMLLDYIASKNGFEVDAISGDLVAYS